MPIDDIVARLRLWSDNAKEQDATDVVVGLCEAADEIERLRGMVNGTANTQGDKVAKEMHHNDGD